MEDETLDPRVRRTRRDVIGTATEVFLEGGWNAVTHAEVARRSGYAKATIYAHWPTQLDLIGDAFEQICSDDKHRRPTGDLHADLVAELYVFGRELTDGDLARVLGGLLERAGTDPAIDAFRHQMHQTGAGPLLEILRAHLPAAEVEPVAALLAGAVYYRATLEGRPVSRPFITQLVDRVLATVDLPAADPPAVPVTGG